MAEGDHHQSRVDGRESVVASREPTSDSRLTTPDARFARRVVIEHIRPTIDAGRFAPKRVVGDVVEVVADIFADGHDVIAAVLLDRHVGTPAAHPSRNVQANSEESLAESAVFAADRDPWRETPMTLVAPGTDEWSGRFDVPAIGWHEYAVVAWIDRFGTWRRDLEIKARAGQPVGLELLEGSLLLRDAAARAEQRDAGADADRLLARADALSDDTPAGERLAAALDDTLAALVAAYADVPGATRSPAWRVWVDRERARFGAWYEMFPRSYGPDPRRSGTFADAARHLTYVADLGFDVVYLPPIHPIGTSFRKGANNALVAGPQDPGSPWAIGSDAGGHTAVEPSLGTIDDFVAFRAEAERLGLEVALDLAFQCSPDHPWVREHPEWFRHRSDGTITYAENPPKKYQDIYPLDFECDDWRALWRALLDVTLFWVGRGVRLFRVDNPHTKTFGFWEWLIDEVHARDPRVLFLAEAFTRPKLMRYLAKAGFSESYTYFTWRIAKTEIADYLSELTGTDVREYLRPNFFANTPDILHEYLQQGGRPAFEARLLLAATLAASYGIYSGFELCERRATAPGSEEYLDSEKYQIRHRDWEQSHNIRELIARVNRIRHEEPALQANRTLRFHDTDNPQIVAYSKVDRRAGPHGSTSTSGAILVVVNLDPFFMQHGWVRVPLDRAGLDPQTPFVAHDLLDDVRYTWRGEWNYVRFDPDVRQGHVLKLCPSTLRT